MAKWKAARLRFDEGNKMNLIYGCMILELNLITYHWKKVEGEVASLEQ